MSARPEASSLVDPELASVLISNALAQLEFFQASLRSDGGFDLLDHAGRAIPDQPQTLMTTARLVHAYALGHLAGAPACTDILDAGMAALKNEHRDRLYGGYLPIARGNGAVSEDKLAYGHVFVLLAAASAKAAGHDEADRVLAEVCADIDMHFWDEGTGRLRDEFRRDWTVFSKYRGMNANMHGIEAFLSAFEATGDEVFLLRAGRILTFFTNEIAPAYGWHLPEHYTAEWAVDRSYAGDPMFRPAGTTPGHSFELGRLLLQYWDLSGRPNTDAPRIARRLIETAADAAWQPTGGFAYTLDFKGNVAVSDRYWWPVAEAMGAFSSLHKLSLKEVDAEWFRRLWNVANRFFVDHDRGGWYPEIDEVGRPVERQFTGKPDIYHALQACIYPLTRDLSGYYKGIRDHCRYFTGRSDRS
ncbi:AGE family epimerase/isomerase [Celeribacter persicus]|jgi:N-acyl-D-glucosamine 2-epimerase|uniref:Mannose/cellobiose epimerase-like protein (N-acyl-D-glucosamine 2-epimerase family) n=1 Tax=Celeribacter persicus TaxID=1651082 RepID=A0A2T5HP55_9RHOB|nr:AGE family epimerase/isomerase [Celeribacter persicus]PTQ73324.1 mannose/cellobiose epimerase-like protein (N-acyl-D-glucosamine 2-epimerase family) [Celeribacter persicus]